MKKFVIAFTILASIVTTTTYANDGVVTPEVLQSFQTTFASAKNAGWSKTADLYKVEFTLNGQPVTAFYKQDGTMAAATRNLSFTQLPVALQTDLKKEYSDFWITGLFELSNEEGVQYYITVEDANNQVILKSTSATWNLFQKQRKD